MARHDRQFDVSQRRAPERTQVAFASLPLQTGRASAVRLSEVLSSLSYALDLTEGHPAGHTTGTAVIGMRLAAALGLDVEQQSALYYALLLKDAGCSSNAARMAALFGSPDQVIKYRMKFVDWHRRVPLALHTALNVGYGQGLSSRVQHFLGIARTKDVTRNLIQTRCERGAHIVAQLGFPQATVEAIYNLDEHWNGQGYPAGKRGDHIPLLARIANIAQTMQLFNTAYGADAALRVARTRCGTWFDPQLVNVLLQWKHDRTWWQQLRVPDQLNMVLAAEPSKDARTINAADLDAIASAFATIIDAKSPYTFRHSTNVAECARGIAQALGVTPPEAHRVYRAGLLHDIGKLGVSSQILEKAGQLSTAERDAIEWHPVHTWNILSRVPVFHDLAWIAALHHEKLDGSGYPWKLTAPQLPTEARILVVADMYEALTTDRPYRRGLASTAAIDVLLRDAGTRLCADVLDGLVAFVERHPQWLDQVNTAPVATDQ